MSKNKLRKILFFIWPPYEAYVADVAIRDETHQDTLIRMKKIKNDINSRIPENISGLKIIENESKDLYDSEIQRKEILESKATEFTAGFGLAISILSIFPILIGDNWGVSEFVKIILGITHGSVNFAAGFGKPTASWVKISAEKSSSDRIFVWTSDNGDIWYKICSPNMTTDK